MKKRKDQYPDNWEDIRKAVLARAGKKCELCGAPNYKPHWKTGSKVVLTIHHIDNDTRNSKPYNLLALCQRCHLKLDLPFKIKKREGELGEVEVMKDYKGWSFFADIELRPYESRIILQNIYAHNYEKLECPLKIEDIEGNSSWTVRKKLENAIDTFECNFSLVGLEIYHLNHPGTCSLKEYNRLKEKYIDENKG